MEDILCATKHVWFDGQLSVYSAPLLTHASTEYMSAIRNSTQLAACMMRHNNYINACCLNPVCKSILDKKRYSYAAAAIFYKCNCHWYPQVLTIRLATRSQLARLMLLAGNVSEQPLDLAGGDPYIHGLSPWLYIYTSCTRSVHTSVCYHGNKSPPIPDCYEHLGTSPK